MNKYAILICLILSACASTQRVSYVTGTSQATIALPENARNITLLNRVRLGYPYNRSTTVLNPNNPDLLNAMFNTVRSSIRNQNYLRIFSESASFNANANGAFPNALTVAELKQVGMGADLVVSLEKFGQRIEDTYTVEIRRENLGNSTYREVDFFIGKRAIEVTLGWRLYNRSTGQIIDTWEERKDYFYEAESRSRQRTTLLLNNNYRNEMQKLGVYFGRTYASRISPTEYRTTANLYNDGNDVMRKAIIEVQAENWDEAANIWERAISSERKAKRKAMLMHNLAINEQRKGNDQAAREWAAKAANLHPLGVETQSIVGFTSTAF